MSFGINLGDILAAIKLCCELWRSFEKLGTVRQSPCENPWTAFECEIRDLRNSLVSLETISYPTRFHPESSWYHRLLFKSHVAAMATIQEKGIRDVKASHMTDNHTQRAYQRNNDWYISLEEPRNPQFDLYFVHGLGGNAFSSWASGTSDRMWPRDCFPEQFRTQEVRGRFSSLGYDANVFGKEEPGTIQNAAQSLLRQINSIPGGKNPSHDPQSPGRDIIFCGAGVTGLDSALSTTLHQPRKENREASPESSGPYGSDTGGILVALVAASGFMCSSYSAVVRGGIIGLGCTTAWFLLDWIQYGPLAPIFDLDSVKTSSPLALLARFLFGAVVLNMAAVSFLWSSKPGILMNRFLASIKIMLLCLMIGWVLLGSINPTSSKTTSIGQNFGADTWRDYIFDRHPGIQASRMEAPVDPILAQNFPIWRMNENSKVHEKSEEDTVKFEARLRPFREKSGSILKISKAIEPNVVLSIMIEKSIMIGHKESTESSKLGHLSQESYSMRRFNARVLFRPRLTPATTPERKVTFTQDSLDTICNPKYSVVSSSLHSICDTADSTVLSSSECTAGCGTIRMASREVSSLTPK